MYMINVYLVLFFYAEWCLYTKLLNLLLDRARKMKKLTVLLAFCWVLLVSQILAISSMYNDGLQDIPGTPSVITLVDQQASELNIESRLEENIEATLKNISHQLINSPVDEPEEQQATLDQQQPQEEELPEDATEVQAAPEQAASPEEKIQDTGGGEIGKEEQPEVVQQVIPNVTFDPQHAGSAEENPMPVFSEWAQKQMAEAEKKHGENVNASAMKRNSKPPGNKMPPLKLRAKNYAAPDCGAKIIASNPEAQSTGSVLTSHKDEYLLNPCTSKIWFVVELCEPVQAERVELANFELFSSSPKEFSVSVSNRFPTRDWSNVGQFTAKDERDVQSFNLHPHLFGKFVRVEIHSHYNSEHYCPVSLFRVYGTSEFEAFETDNTPSLAEDGEEDDDVELTIEGLNLIEEILGSEENMDGGDPTKNKKANILKSAGEAVMNIVKKAAEALGKTNENDSLRNETESINGSIGDNQLGSIGVVAPQHPLYCFSLAFQPLCVSCPPELRNRLERTLNCKYNLLTSLLSIKSISTSFDESQHLLCANFLGFNLKREQVSGSYNIERSILSWLPADVLASFCNLQAYERGMIETRMKFADTSVKKPERPTSTEPPSTTQSDKDEPQNDTDDQPTLTVIPSVTAPVTVEPSSPSPPNPEQQPSPSLDDVNMFNVGVPQDTDSVTAKHTEEPSATIPTTSTTTTVPVVDSTQERDDSGLLDQQNSGSSMEELDNLLLDQQMDGLSAGSGSIPTITTTSTTTPSPGAPVAQKGQPESVFLRLSNRIKALERNMSLSGQYLEELSRRYRKQVEELQHSYAKTLHDIEEQNRRMRDSETQLREENERLRENFYTFRDSILSWKNIALAVGGFLVVQVVVVYAMIRSCASGGRRADRDEIARELEHMGDQKPPVKGKLLRRRSIDGVMGVADEKAIGSLKKKRPSEEALNISGTYENLLIAENGGGDSAKVERKKKNKQRKISAPSMVQQTNGNGKVKRASSVEPSPVGKIGKAELVRTESAPEPRRHSPEKPKPDENNRIEELPLLEDNDEFIIPTAMDLSYNEFVPDSTSETVNQTNGMISSSSSIDSKSTNKSGKGRRLSSPAFFKSSLLRSSRKSSGKKSTPSQNVSSASSNTSSTGSSNVRININVHNVNRTEDELSSLPTDDAQTTSSTLNTPVSHQHSWEWYKLKKSSSQDKVTKRKSKSESPEVETTRHNNGSINGSEDHRLRTSVSFNGSTGSSEKKIGGGTGGGSFRRLFRKVF
ncbi:SUN domain-containing ossification factor isoform X2 [Aedes aegypti]|uniref:SUN domain-containing protein n=1 Tax=Aedes aegypti TaxID=7159 RepID=A0A6I8T522_AEDAE|nr:SUN domain-containing ossification factor isoform X2 [Aedes aegypti]XP_021703377.1 SUN domain-containing ossification factor isoform X2 [Aedes aegypti]XP_021703379.1 SUN domain-containing ossification factor isoform X2 [Aedes aegypti]XP_021703380.1 SUN domain-containing ossification factor isoform X2 [Aedes aegypti]XP_021703381.1 SUN domain-containing ossification factor isoform X2 [Aedes aegypti]XP_021703382.1 SUN domain-containing ossification factor isoform X2 [Aedes aegypti]XP_02170338